MIPQISQAPGLVQRVLDFLEALKQNGFNGDTATSYADRLTMATDNSIYQLLPDAVVFPRSTADVALIARLADRCGVRCIVVGIDTWFDAETGKYHVNQYTGDESRTRITQWETLDWVQEVQRRGAGEIVLNMMNQDGVRNGYDLQQLRRVREACKVPLIASGGAGTMEHFLEAFRDADVDGALAASVFHKQIINIGELKRFLVEQGVEIRVC